MAMERIEVKGARAHNLKNIDVNIPRDQLVSLRDYLVQENRRLPLIPFMQKVSAGTLNLFQRMHANFLGKWINRM